MIGIRGLGSPTPTNGLEAVNLSISTENPVSFKLRLRIPSWLASTAKLKVNGAEAATGTPGTYCAITRTWKEDDIIAFTLPMEFRVSRYTGLDQIDGYDRYAIEFGTVLLGVVGDNDFNNDCIKITDDPANPESWLDPVPEKPLHYKIKGKPGYENMQYYEIQDEQFTCYPVIAMVDQNRKNKDDGK